MREIFLYQAFECATVAFETFIVYQYINSFFDKHCSKRDILFGYVLYFLGLCIFSLLWRQPLVLTIYSIIGLCLLELFLYKTEISSIIFSVFFFAVLMAVTEFLCAGIMVYIANVDLELTWNYGLPRMLCIIVAKFIQIFLVKLLNTFMNWKRGRTGKIEFKRLLPLLLCQIISISLAYQVFLIGYHIYNSFNLNMFISMAGLIYINIILFWYFDSIKEAYEYKSRNEIAEAMLGMQIEYYQKLEEHQSETYAIRHDMKKHILLIKSLVYSGQQEIAEDYVRELEENTYILNDVIYTTQPVIGALLNDVRQKAKWNEVSLDLNACLSDNIKISPLDLCVLIGNVFDNAMEACLIIPDGIEKCIKAELLQKDSMLLFKVDNPYCIDENHHKKGPEHGYGIRNIRKVVEKYDGSVEIVKTNLVYSIEIIIP